MYLLLFFCFANLPFNFLKTKEDNKLGVRQSLILHVTVLKRKAALDQFRKGLATLGVLAEIEKNPAEFEKLFTEKKKSLQGL